MRRALWYCIFTFGLFSCQNSYEKFENGLLVRVKHAKNNGAHLLKIKVVNDKIIHVQATAGDEFSKDTSLMCVQNKKSPNTDWKLIELPDTLVVATKNIKLKIAIATGELVFTDTLGNVIVQEEKSTGKTFEPNPINGKPLWKIHQVYESTPDEAFYGLGQHQNGFMNFKGKDVDLFQFNSMVAIPFVVSNKNYGILWDNYSQSKFGDVRDYQPLSSLKLYDASGKEGGLTAIYRSVSDSNKVFVNQIETKIDYEFITSLKTLPAMFPMNQGLVIWKGYIASDTTGIHKFRFYNAGYAKVWINGKLVVDRWRQSWNPSSTYFTYKFEKDKKYSIKIEWNPDGGESYVGLRCLKPLPDGQQEKLSLYSEAAAQIDYYFIKGDNLDDVISGYRTITGKATIMPKWALGFWQSRERYKTQEEILNTVAEFRKRQIPLDNIVLDWHYWPEDKWGDHNFDSSRFKNPVLMMNELHEKYNAHMMVSVWPKFYIGTNNYKLFDEKGWLYKKNILDKQKDWVGPGYVSTFYDAYNPEARKLFWNLINEKLYSKGIDGWWLDASEPDIHSNCSIEDRKALTNPNALGTSTEYFNAFPFVNAKAVYDGQRETNPNQRVFILTRSAYAGQQRFAAATWSGDIGARWDEMKAQISAGLNFCISGIPYWTMDIGGFAVEHKFDNPQGNNLEEWREQMARWYEFGTFCPLFRSHGQYPYREVFNIAPENHPVYKAIVSFDKLRYRLMPYIYSLAGMAYHNDYTIMRALVMDFTNDTNVLNINSQFMFGPSILVNPVTEFHAVNRTVYLPDGTGWYDLFSGKYYAGGKIITASAPIEQIPLFIKEGSIVPVGPVVQYAMQKSAEPITIFVYTGKDALFNLYDDEGINYNYEKGEYANIPFTYNETTKSLKIGQRVGSFNGMEPSKRFRIIWVDKLSENSINLNADIKNGDIYEYTGNELIVNRK